MQKENKRMHRTSRLLFWGALALGLLIGNKAPAQVVFVQDNLVTDDPAINPARITDTSLVNAWGVSLSGGSPFWVSDNGTGVATLYRVDPITNVPTKQGLTVSIPGDGTVTGQVFSGTTAFNGDSFLFVSEDGTISGWRGALGTTAETLVTGSAANVYKGSALGVVGGHSYLYAANFRTGAIDVLKGDAAAPTLSGSFTDPTLPSGFAPFNTQVLNGTLYVTYAKQDAAKHDDVEGVGYGFVDAYNLNGTFIGRVGSQGTLDSPWGLAFAPSSFGIYSGDLLVGNFGNGRINAFNPLTNSFIGQLNGANGTTLSIDGLWALTPGNNGAGGSSGKLYFSAGTVGESHGLFGSLQAVPEPTPLLWSAALLVPAGWLLSRRRTRGNHRKPM
jgi:uncharacterized protein (TIGR03118 family)